MRMQKLIKTWNLFVAKKDHQQVRSPCFFPMISLSNSEQKCFLTFLSGFQSAPNVTQGKILEFVVVVDCLCCQHLRSEKASQAEPSVESSLSNSNAAILVERLDQPMCLWYTINRYLCTWRYILFFKPTVMNIWNWHDVKYLDCCERFRLDV